MKPHWVFFLCCFWLLFLLLLLLSFFFFFFFYFIFFIPYWRNNKFRKHFRVLPLFLKPDLTMFLSHKIELQNRARQNDIILRVTYYSKFPLFFFFGYNNAASPNIKIHFKLLVRRLNFCFFAQVFKTNLKNIKLYLELLTQHYQLILEIQLYLCPLSPSRDLFLCHLLNQTFLTS